MILVQYTGMYWLRRGHGGFDKRVEGSHGPSLNNDGIM